MAKKKEPTVEQKLRALYDLQLIDSRIDKIRDIRGELPLEVRDLEDEIEGLNTRIEKLDASLKDFDVQISDKKNLIEEAKVLIKKYTEQQKNVRNNREFDSLSKEIEYQELEAQLAEKRIKENSARIDGKKEILEEIQNLHKAKEEALEAKKKELEEIISETEREEKILMEESLKASKSIDERFLKAYNRIREASKNGLAVVPVERGASGGSFIKIPPQVQLDIAARKKIIVDEHSGRILVDALLADEQSTKMNRKINKVLSAK
jgi:predicted  nucleic acid-binding Zn-ribbon protein